MGRDRLAVDGPDLHASSVADHAAMSVMQEAGREHTVAVSPETFGVRCDGPPHGGLYQSRIMAGRLDVRHRKRGSNPTGSRVCRMPEMRIDVLPHVRFRASAFEQSTFFIEFGTEFLRFFGL